jgi:hypothetical protein
MAVFAIICLALAGCAADTIVYDPSVPQEKLCTLKIGDELYVYEFDAADVEWSSGFLKSPPIVKIPEGRHTLVMDYISGGSRYTFFAKEIMYSHTFEAGKSYVMKAVRANNRVSIEVVTE